MILKDLIKKDGTIVPLQSRKYVTRIESCTQNVRLMEQDTISMSIKSTVKQNYQIGDSIDLFGKIYKLNKFPTVTKTATNDFTYNLEFESIMYDLGCVSYNLTIELTGNKLQDVQADSLIGDLNRYMTVLIANMERNYPGKWVLGTCPSTANDVFLSFNDADTCLSVLNILCEQFNVEYEIVENNGVNTINLGAVGEDKDVTFQYGRSNGLYEISRENIDTQDMCTRLMVYGGTENITTFYRAIRLLLPGKNKSNSFIEDSAKISQYRLFEKTKCFDDIYPTRTGSVTRLVVGSHLKFVDSTMFDLNDKFVSYYADGDPRGSDDFHTWWRSIGSPQGMDYIQLYNDTIAEKTTKYIIAGIEPKVCFLTGNLAGYTFIISSYDSIRKEFTLIEQEIEGGTKIPSTQIGDTYRIGVGDTYKLVDISLPQSYVEDAESRLQTAAQEYFNKNSVPRVEYNVKVSAIYLQKKVGTYKTNLVRAGDSYKVIDNDLGIDNSLRIISYSRDLLKEDQYTLTLAEFDRKSFIEKLTTTIIDNKRRLDVNDIYLDQRLKLENVTSTMELKGKLIPNGSLNVDLISDLSIDWGKLIVLNPSSAGQFLVSDGNGNVTFEKRYQEIISTDDTIDIGEFAQTTLVRATSATPKLQLDNLILKDGYNFNVTYLNENGLSTTVTLPDNVVFENDIKQMTVPMYKSLQLEVIVADAQKGIVQGKASLFRVSSPKPVLYLPLIEDYEDKSENEFPIDYADTEFFSGLGVIFPFKDSYVSIDIGELHQYEEFTISFILNMNKVFPPKETETIFTIFGGGNHEELVYLDLKGSSSGSMLFDIHFVCYDKEVMYPSNYLNTNSDDNKIIISFKKEVGNDNRINFWFGEFNHEEVLFHGEYTFDPPIILGNRGIAEQQGDQGNNLCRAIREFKLYDRCYTKEELDDIES